MQFTTLMAVLATCSVVLTSPLSQQISAAAAVESAEAVESRWGGWAW
ncbi:hypothetical protein PSTT_12386 [Puccinia striiformis]|nr:hypothetical protein PSTT_12386 [Puccinia striiformis]